MKKYSAIVALLTISLWTRTEVYAQVFSETRVGAYAAEAESSNPVDAPPEIVTTFPPPAEVVSQRARVAPSYGEAVGEASLEGGQVVKLRASAHAAVFDGVPLVARASAGFQDKISVDKFGLPILSGRLSSTFVLSGSIGENNGGEAMSIAHVGMLADPDDPTSNYDHALISDRPGAAGGDVDILWEFLAEPESEILLEVSLSVSAQTGIGNSSAFADFHSTAELFRIVYIGPDGLVDPDAVVRGASGLIYSDLPLPPVPEPTTSILTTLGLIGVVMIARTRRRPSRDPIRHAARIERVAGACTRDS